MNIDSLFTTKIIIEGRRYLCVSNEIFLPLLKFIRERSYYRNTTQYFYRIGEIIFSTCDESLDEILSNAPELIDTLIFRPFEYKVEDCNEDGDPLGTFVLKVSNKLIAALKFDEIEKSNMERLSLIFNIIAETEERLKRIHIEEEIDDEVEEIEYPKHSYGHSVEDWMEPDDMDEIDPTWRIANDLG